MIRLTLILLAVVGLSGASLSVGPRPVAPTTTASDSAMDEFESGRFWHAARALRSEGVQEGEPADVLLLARAEAGWNNWPAVRSLLETVDWIATTAGGSGLYLLARSLEEAQAWEPAADAFAQYAALAPDRSRRRSAALARGARAEWEAGRTDRALETLQRISEVPAVRSWVAWELAEHAVEDGDPDLVARLLEQAEAADVVTASWRMIADARIAAGDSVGASAAFGALMDESVGTRRASATIEFALLQLASGDSADARALLLEGLSEAPASSRLRAAQALLDLGDSDRELTLRLSRIADRGGDGRRALRGYDRVATMSAEAAVSVPMGTRVERARLMGTVRSRQGAAIEEFRAIRGEVEDRRLGARNLELWAQLRRRQGLSGQVTTLRRWLVEDYPESSQAAEMVYLQGDRAQSRGDFATALARYDFVARNAPSHARAGQSRMNSGQIFFGRDDLEAAANAYESYLRDFPSGRRWQEASYWAGHVRKELGDPQAAGDHVQRITEGDPVSYYAVMGADLMDAVFEVDVPPGADPVAYDWLAEGLEWIDWLDEAGLEAGASAEIARLTSRADGTPSASLALGEALIERGRTIDGINLAWALRRAGQPWDQRLLRVAYPFPYRELVRREAEEWGVDPIVMAAIIRQESAFKADIVSHAGAIGLMQVMPPTGAALARVHGPAGFSSDNLTAPEVNLHLGAAFFVEMNSRYDGDLPLVLSAYNAGPTRANRWRRYPEAADPLRFTERIPFVETRGYVKNVRRNLGLYRALYGDK